MGSGSELQPTKRGAEQGAATAPEVPAGVRSRDVREQLRGLPYDAQVALLTPRRGPEPVEPGRPRRGTEREPDAGEQWVDDVRAMKREYDPERAAKLVGEGEKLVGKLQWKATEPETGEFLGCGSGPFFFAYKAGFITLEQFKHIHQGPDAGADGPDLTTLLLRALDVKPWADCTPAERYPTATMRAGDIAIFTTRDSPGTFYEHMALCTGSGDEILSLQANYDPEAESDPLVKTTVQAYLSGMAGEQACVVIRPFPF